ncbi:unnamed protein product [Symbiodinium natans]|uniref:Uncharacterized protein n=1 Tax=Symbiodinium natans TaxID=878477 RepID=A0A812NC87_9DINO|nr:unnamed protein product [Symbiodinium natans]
MSGYAQQAVAKKSTSDKKGPPTKERVERRPDRTKPMKFDNESGKCGNPAEDNWRPGKRMNIQAQDTGRIQNKTIVSVESPDWMKSFFENNRNYFEQKGIAQKLKKPAGGDATAAGIGSSARAQGKKVGAALRDDAGAPLSPQNMGSEASPDWMNSARKWTKVDKESPDSGWQRAGNDRFTFMVPRTKCRSANNMQHLVVSDHVPDWMRVESALEAVAKDTPRRARSADDLSRAAGVDTHRIWDQSTRNKGCGNIHPSTGRVNYSSQQSPDFPLDSGLEHRQAFEEKARSMPNSARNGYDNGHISAGDKLKDRRSKKGTVMDEGTGKVANNSIVSAESPQWMKQPFESNRSFFEKQGVAEKLRTMSTQEHESNFVAGRKVPVRPKQVFKQIKNEEGKIQNLSIVSIGAPQWMKSPFESNRPYFESQGIAQRRENGEQVSAMELDLQETPESRRSSSAPPRSAKVKGPPSHTAERAQRSRKSGSEASGTGGTGTGTASRRTSSAASATSYSARYTKQLPRQASLGSLQSAR